MHNCSICGKSGHNRRTCQEWRFMTYDYTHFLADSPHHHTHDSSHHQTHDSSHHQTHDSSHHQTHDSSHHQTHYSSHHHTHDSSHYSTLHHTLHSTLHHTHNPTLHHTHNICSICLDTLTPHNLLISPCKNYFHSNCFLLYFKFKLTRTLPTTCPICRTLL